MKIYGVFATVIDNDDLNETAEALKPVSEGVRYKDFLVNEVIYSEHQAKFTKSFASIVKPYRATHKSNPIVRPSDGYIYPSIASIASTLLHDKSFAKLLAKGIDDDDAKLLLFRVFKTNDKGHQDSVQEVADNLGEMYFECEYIDLA